MTESVIDIIAWNVYIGNTPEKVRSNLKPMLDELNPEVAVLMEASRMFGMNDEDNIAERTDKLHDMGYKVIQLKPRPLRKGSTPGQGNIAILVRNDIPIKKRFTQRMTTFWLGPKHGWAQDPRVYRWVKVQVHGRIWKIGGAHTPFGVAARAESRRKLLRKFRNTLPGGRPTALVLDANMSLHDFREGIATPGGALAAGDGIDLIGYKNAVLLLAKNLGKRGSDHPAMFYKLRAK